MFQYMNVRVECPCGQAYEFAVEPVNGAMPCGVACPSCGTDGTPLANDYIRSRMAPRTAVATAASGLGNGIAGIAPTAGGLRIKRQETTAS